MLTYNSKSEQNPFKILVNERTFSNVAGFNLQLC